MRLFHIASGAVLLAGALAPTSAAYPIKCDPLLALGAPTLVTTGSNPLHPLVGDFNEDGKPDLAVTNCNFLNTGFESTVAILIGNGNGSFAAPVQMPVPGQPHFIAAADFNADGITDLAVTGKFSLGVFLFLGQGSNGVGNGTFAPPTFHSTGQQPFQIVAGDYDEDGIVDLAVALNNVPRIGVMRGQGSNGVWNGSFSVPTGYNLLSLGRGISQGDFNSDGILDLVATEYVANRIAVFLGNGAGGVGNGTFAPAVHYAAGIEPVDIHPFDYDADGILDLMVACGNSGGTIILRGQGSGGTGSGTFAFQASAATGNCPTAIPLDVNEDGLFDILAAEDTHPVGRRLHLFLGNGTDSVGDGTWVSAGTIALSDDGYFFGIADFNSDTHDDVVVTGFRSNRMTLLTWGCRRPPLTRGPLVTDGTSGPAVTSVLSLAGARPNPARAGEATILFSLADDTPATLELYDVRGRRVAAPSLDGLGSGTHSIRIDGVVVLAPGVYIVRLIQGETVIERKMA